jgi:hypothetical protein
VEWGRVWAHRDKQWYTAIWLGAYNHHEHVHIVDADTWDTAEYDTTTCPTQIWGQIIDIYKAMFALKIQD